MSQDGLNSDAELIEAVQDYMARHDLSTRELSERTGGAVSHSTIARLGVTKLSKTTRKALQKLLDDETNPAARGTGSVNRAFDLIGRMEHPSAIRRAEGELHYGDLAAGGLEEAREDGYEGRELYTFTEWVVEKLRESERQRLALRRRLREQGAEQDSSSGPPVRDS